jgi:hypothetical protein
MSFFNKFFFSLLFFSFFSFYIEIFSSCKQESFCDYAAQKKDASPWYGVIQTGYAYSFNAGISNPDPGFWDAAVQGYNTNLGGSPFLGVGFGRSLFYYLRADVAYTYFQGFHYQKFQSGSSDTAGFTGSKRNRYFDLDHQNVMFNFSLYPEKYGYFSLAKLEISPYLGLGIGAGFSRVMNFHTVAYSQGVGSTTSIGTKTNKSSFAWQGFTGIRLHPSKACMNLDLGYRYYDGGRFTGPDFVYANTKDLQGNPVPGKPWKGKLRTNQFTIALNFWF